mmetsp:Transcript_33712/g.86445  ORF Transcript_33712/g.86445 Transcript_33712/m.86445 type:complete len:174 (-) Transcript_33712:1973-2494(-)
MGASQTREAERIDGPIEPAPAPAVEAFAPSTPVGIDQSDASLLPTYFRWDGPGDRVYLMGSFDGWSQKLPLRRSSGDLVYSINLPPGEYQYKFVVDDEYRVSQAEPLSKAKDGTLVNVITVEASVSTEPKQADSKHWIGLFPVLPLFSVSSSLSSSLYSLPGLLALSCLVVGG